ncbi:hypothetical protein WR25_07819 [Diploscapter pachys]|uniref:D-glucuronyl C5-epimerase C-terminal domain-containing protein n=1 Tax=Diploscapter pachys TaxID=2018661 RepID=A0A2A2LDU2_9BILA|nr:hypothetical protein WR25_07819 [Diploscapter pachys]
MIRLRSLRNSILCLVILISGLLFINLFFGYSATQTANQPIRADRDEANKKEKECDPQQSALIREEKCNSDWGKEMKCLREDEEVYFPFSFIKKKWDVTGKMAKDGKRFEMFTSYSKVRLPEGSYDSKGVFGHFASYSVESRDRVRCINAKTGIPMSTQWDEIPYYYPIQIAQFGLQHYSRLHSANFSKYEEVRMGTMTKEWKGSAAMADTNERLFWKDEQLGGLVNITSTGDIRIVSVGFRGSCTVKRVIVQSNERHKESFLTAANWMLHNQDTNGGWPVPVERAIADRQLVLPAGWYSAMGQGHAISLLTRAYWTTKNESYLEACAKSLALFEKLSKDGGVKNQLWGIDWCEEYPTNPGSFVLNGFMYSLLGLYDFSRIPSEEVSSVSVREGISKAALLWSKGLDSLLTLLPLYDTGSGSIYDLRHIGLKSAPNLARWDYHAVHIYLLKWLVQITENQYLNEIADRWIGYAHGKRAKHN